MLSETVAKAALACVKLQERLLGQPWREVAAWLAPGNIITVGVGKSGYVARKIASTFATYGINARFLHPTEMAHGELGGVRATDRIIAVTAGGKTAELQAIAKPAWLWYENTLVLTAAESPELPYKYILRVPQVIEPVPLVGAILLQLLGDGLAAEAARLRGFSPEDLLKYHPANRTHLESAKPMP